MHRARSGHTPIHHLSPAPLGPRVTSRVGHRIGRRSAERSNRNGLRILTQLGSRTQLPHPPTHTHQHTHAHHTTYEARMHRARSGRKAKANAKASLKKPIPRQEKIPRGQHAERSPEDTCPWAWSHHTAVPANPSGRSLSQPHQQRPNPEPETSARQRHHTPHPHHRRPRQTARTCPKTACSNGHRYRNRQAGSPP